MVLECFGSLKGDIWQILIDFDSLPGWYPWCGIYTLRCHFITLADSTQVTQVTQVTVLQDRNSAVSQPSHTQPSTQHLENLEASTQKTPKTPLEYLWNSMNISCQNRCQVMKFLHCRRIFSKLWTHVIKAASLEALGILTTDIMSVQITLKNRSGYGINWDHLITLKWCVAVFPLVSLFQLLIIFPSIHCVLKQLVPETLQIVPGPKAKRRKCQNKKVNASLKMYTCIKIVYWL